MANFSPFDLGQLALQLQQPGGVDRASTLLAQQGARVPQVPTATLDPAAGGNPGAVPATAIPGAAPQPAGGNPGAGLANFLAGPAAAAITRPPAPQLTPVPPAPGAVNPGGPGAAAIPAINDLIMQLLQGGAQGGQPPGALSLGQLIQGV